MLYILTLILSFFTLLINIIMCFSEPDSYIFKMFNETDIWVCIGICIVFIIIGLIRDKRNERNN